MPKTIIVKQTYHCTACSKWLYDEQGEFVQRLGHESEMLKAVCSTKDCTGELYLETDPAKCCTATVIGDEDIEKEIDDMQAERVSKGRAEYAANVIAGYRNQRRAEKDAAITAARIKEKK